MAQIHPPQVHQEQPKEQPAQKTDASNVVIGPRPYNRFVGNPPVGQTAEEAFKTENGYDWLPEVMFQEIRDRIDKLEVERDKLEVQVNHLMAKNAILTQELVLAKQAPQHANLGAPTPHHNK